MRQVTKLSEDSAGAAEVDVREYISDDDVEDPDVTAPKEQPKLPSP